MRVKSNCQIGINESQLKRRQSTDTVDILYIVQGIKAVGDPKQAFNIPKIGR